MSRALRPQVRPGSGRYREESVYKFPFEAFEADKAQGDSNPKIMLTRPWLFSAFLETLSTSADYTLDADDGIMVVEGTGGAAGITVTLPAIADSFGRVVIGMKADSGGGAVTFDGNGSETIDGSTTLALASQYDCCVLFGGSSEWINIL